MKVTFKGRWFATLYGENGAVKDYREGDNIITDVGKSFLVEYLNSAAASATQWGMFQIAVGSDSTTEAASNTALGTELARQTGAAGEAAGAIYRVTATFASGVGTGGIVEYGLFSSSTGGTMFSRDTENIINKGANDTLAVTTDITVS